MRRSKNPIIMDDTSATQESRSTADSLCQKQAEMRFKFSIDLSDNQTV